MDIRLDGRSAVVTGGSKGLGRAMAQRFAASGADVAILARTPETLAAAKQQIQAGAKGKVATVSADVSKVADIRRAYDQVMSELGKIDILVNNAGQATSGPSEEVTDEMWQADLGQPCRANGVLQGARGRECASQHPGQLIACRGHRQRPDRSPPSLGWNRLFVAPRLMRRREPAFDRTQAGVERRHRARKIWRIVAPPDAHR
jgi:short chain dehydrogenase